MSTNEEPPRLLYRPTEAAQQLGVSRTKMYELIRLGEKRMNQGLCPFPGVRSGKIGDCRRISRSALDEYAAALMGEATAA